jgi:hypothetical protein
MRGNRRRVVGTASTLAALTVAATSSGWAADIPTKAPRDPMAMPVGGWLLSPTLFAGAVYNTNVNQTETGRVASWGERVIPGFSAVLDNGIHQTSIYGLADLQAYNASGANHKTTVDAKAGFTQTYLATRDLTFRINGDYTRQADVFGSSAFTPGNTPLSPTSGAPVAPTTVAPQVAPDRFNQFAGSIAAEKRIGRAFLGLTTSAVNTTFDNNSAFPTSRDGTVYTVTQRSGYDITPQLYTFVDPSYHWQRYTDSTRNSQGYRVTGGVGTAAPGLWQGEVYGGYQAEKNDIVGTYGGGVYGLRVAYAPTRMWDLRASLDETLGASTIATGGLTGVASRITTALLNVGYRGLPRGWEANARFGTIYTHFINAPRNDNGWLAGANLTYEVWRNLGLTLDYQYKSVNSNVVGQSFNQQVVSLGASYRY